MLSTWYASSPNDAAERNAGLHALHIQDLADVLPFLRLRDYTMPGTLDSRPEIGNL